MKLIRNVWRGEVSFVRPINRIAIRIDNLADLVAGNFSCDSKIEVPSYVVADIGVYAFTMLEYVSGLRVESLLADLSSYANAAGLDDDTSILMRLDSGAKAALVTSKVVTGEENGVRARLALSGWAPRGPRQGTGKHLRRVHRGRRLAACVRSMRFVAAALKSSKAGSRWTKV